MSFGAAFNKLRLKYSFLPFLISVIGIILLPGVLYNVGSPSVIAFNTCYSVVVLLGIMVVAVDRLSFGIALLLGGAAIFAFWYGAFQSKLWELGFWEIITGLLFFSFVGWKLAKLMFLATEVDLNLIFGAIAGYLVLGIIGGQLCALLAFYVPDAFTIANEQLSAYKYFYYSFVTLSTLGYGDIVPNNDAGGALTVLLSLSGQIYLTIIMAILIGKFVMQPKSSIQK